MGHGEQLAAGVMVKKIFTTITLAMLFATPAAAQDFAAGWQAYERGDYAAALKEWRTLADRGDAHGQTALGHAYKTGRGVPQDYTEAARWYRLAADQGDATAQYFLGVLYNLGEGVPQDYAEALRWYRLAADQGDADAQNALGYAYDTGQGVPQDHIEAVRWYRLAANQGDATAQSNLGYAYEIGAGVPQDFVSAYMWTDLSCLLANEIACRSLDEVATRMTAADISEAHRRAHVCLESDYRDCD